MPKQPAEEACRPRRRRLQLRLLHLIDLRPRLVQRQILHQNRLGQFVNRVRIAAQTLPEHLFGLGILLCQLRFLYLLNQVLKHRAFLRCHDTTSNFLDAPLRAAFHDYDAGNAQKWQSLVL